MSSPSHVAAAIVVTLLSSVGLVAAQADLIFADGFESGDVSAWSQAAGYIVVPLVDLRADVNRNGTVDLDDPAEDQDEDTWDSSHGAIFLANLDDDQSACPTTGTNEQLAACFDAADEVVNGVEDLIDMARVKTVPWPNAPEGAWGTIVVSGPGNQYVHLFKGSGSSFAFFDPQADTLSAADLRAGVELALEGTDLVRNATVWDGFVDLTLQVETGTQPPDGRRSGGSDTVRLRLAPVLFRHHLHAIETAYANVVGWPGSVEFRTDLQAALTAAGTPNPLYAITGYSNQWTQDRFETSYTSMPAVGGQHVLHVNFRMPEYTGSSLYFPGRVVYTHLRGPDVGAAVQYDPTHPDSMDHYNSGGNMETIPPFSFGGSDWPLGRVVFGGTATEYPDRSFTGLVADQGQQGAAFIDTSWLAVGHVDETLSYVKADSARGWVTLVADPAGAWTMLGDLQSAGYGQVPMFVGMTWYDGSPAEITIDAVLADTDLANDNAWAATEVAAQVDQLKALTGLEDGELVSVPFLFYYETYGLLAYQPGLTNGISISYSDYGAPQTHGPDIGGSDPFKTGFEAALAPYGITVRWIENWDLYHALWGEVHCGSNATRQIPLDHLWWEVAQ